MEFIVWQHGPRAHRGLIRVGGTVRACALGRSGIARDKREGDGATPAGIWPLRRILYRADRRPRPQTALPAAAIGLRDGWCDAPGDPAYNRPVRLPPRAGPPAASAETLRRHDRLYDTVVILGHNDTPPVPGLGSAIFLHLARDGYAPTEGCVALAPDDLDALLARATPASRLRILAPAAGP